VVARDPSKVVAPVRARPGASSSGHSATLLSKVKTEERKLARRLRRDEGLPLKEIARRLGVAVSSVSLWVRDIELTPEQHDELRRRNPAYNAQLSGTWVQAVRYREKRRMHQNEGRLLARRGDVSFVAGCMLYWAEGAKDRNQLQFSNSDPTMVRFFVEFLRAHFDLRNEDIRITCHLYADHQERQHEIERHWLDTLGLPDRSLRKSVVNVYSKYSKRKRVGNLPYGTCRVVVSRTRVIQTIFGAIQELGGFTREAWLE
jgi:transcriptional regulator with XRE-family HTH domain